MRPRPYRAWQLRGRCGDERTRNENAEGFVAGPVKEGDAARRNQDDSAQEVEA